MKKWWGLNPVLSAWLQILWRIYVPLAKPVYTAFALVSVSFHWNNFLWPLVVTNSVSARPLTVGLQVFSSTDQGIDWSIITAATLITRSIHKPGQYSGAFPFDDNASWEKNAATLRQLHTLRDRIRALEKKQP